MKCFGALVTIAHSMPNIFEEYWEAEISSVAGPIGKVHNHASFTQHSAKLRAGEFLKSTNLFMLGWYCPKFWVVNIIY